MKGGHQPRKMGVVEGGGGRPNNTYQSPKEKDRYSPKRVPRSGEPEEKISGLSRRKDREKELR